MMALAPLLYNITFDSQTRILYFWDKAGHEIYHCEIPSPAPALPTVSYIGQLCVANRAQLAMNANEVAALRKWDVNETIPYNASYKYSASKYSSGGSQEYSAADNFKIQAKSQGGSYILAVKNVSGAAKVFYYIYAYSCDSPDATVITVYDSSNNPYNAFKYTLNGTDYYYVLDGTQTDWTDDLSSIGYHLPVFPLDLIVGMDIDNSTGELIAVTFDYSLEDNYWNTRVKSLEDKELLRDLGLWYDYSSYLYGSVLNASSLYQYEIIEIYTGVGEDVAPFDLSDFYIPDYLKLSLGCTSSYSTPVKSWKLRITPISPALPTVEMINSRIGTIDSVGTISLWSNGDSAYQWRSIGGVYSLYTTENTSYIVCCGRINNTTASNAVFYGFDAEFDLQGHIKITNNTGSAYSNAYSSLSYVCKNSSATVITVYDSNNNPYNAFKYTSDGTDYYYVLDGIQTDWTDDLSAIGYHVPPALPTVSTTWLVITPGTGNLDIPTNGDHVGYWWDSGSQSYISADWDSGVTYGMIAFYTTPFAYAGRMELEIKEVSGTVGVHNVSSSAVTVCQANIAVCSSNLATVITVYDSSNNPYNAFQYTSDGTDYYYVLDGTQTDWTDDLSAIGYHLPEPTPNVEEYIPGALGEITSGSYKSTNLSYDSTKVYMFAGRDDSASFVYRDVTCWEVFGNTGTAMVRNMTNNTIYVNGSGMVATDKTYVTAINVYNSNNIAYPCFKFNGGQVKYWVWDGAHQYWTSDLASVGYKLPTIGYLSSDKTPKSMNAGDLETLYDENGTKMTVSTYGVSYPAVRVYSSSSDTTGTAVVNNNWTVHGPQFSSGDLSVSNLTGSTQIIQRIAFIK